MNKLYKLVAAIAIALVLTGCEEAAQPEQRFSAVDITGGAWGKNFQLIDHDGQPKTLADFKDKAVVLSFGYTNCPDMCPMTMYKLATAVQQLGNDANRVQVLFVTLDPMRDTREILKQYVPAFHPTFLGMIGDEQTIDATAKEFKVFYKHQKPDASGFYTVDHMGPSFIFDPQGRLRLFISDEHSADAIAKDLRTLLKG